MFYLIVVFLATAAWSSEYRHTFHPAADSAPPIVLLTSNANDLRLLKNALVGRTDISASRIRTALDSLGFFDIGSRQPENDTSFIVSGVRYSIDSIQVISPLEVTSDSLTPVQLPMPYSASFVRALADTAIRYFASRGYPFAQLSTRITTHRASEPPGGNARLTFYIDPREQYAFGASVIGGTTQTRRDLLMRDIGLPPGEVFDIRLIRNSLERLNSRPYISSVQSSAPFVIEKEGLIQSQRSPDSLPTVAVPFAIEDKSGLGIDGALTVESMSEGAPDIAGVLDVTVLNAFGTGEQASLSYRGEDVLQLFEISVTKPWVMGTPLWASGGFGLEIKQRHYGHTHANLHALTELKTLWLGGIGIRGHETMVDTDTNQTSLTFYGADLVLLRNAERYGMGTSATRFRIRTGTGVARSTGRSYTRWTVDFLAGRRMPFFRRWALDLRFAAHNLFTPEKNLPPVELFRVGGHNSLRGYSTDEFSFRTAALLQSEFIFFFGHTSSVYLLLDAGTGYDSTPSERVNLLGYGLGTRLPTRLGLLSIEWARNVREVRGLGRLHVGFQNPLSLTGMLQ